MKLETISKLNTKLTLEEIQEIRERVEEYFDEIEMSYVDGKTELREGFFSDLKNAMTAVTKSVADAGNVVKAKVGAEFKTAQERTQFKNFEKKMVQMLYDIQDFDTNPDIQAVLKKDAKFTQQIKNLAKCLSAIVKRFDDVARNDFFK